MNTKTEMIQELRKAMKFYQELGFEYLPVRDTELISPLNDINNVESDRPKGVSKNYGLGILRDKIGECGKCALSKGRKNVVFGEGAPDARIMFIGEGPGRKEDIQARPFVGDAGKLLTNLIVKLGMKREDVYIANIVKCRPPNNRNPEKDEIAECIPLVEKQIELINPDVIVCLGRVSANALLRINMPISKMRGNFYQYKDIPVMPTFHPTYLLRNTKDKWLTWDDMQKVLEKLR